MLKIELDMKDYPKGYEFDLGGVVVKNGSSVEIDADKEQELVARYRQPVKDHFESNAAIKVTGTPKYSGKDVSDMFPPSEPVVIPSPYLEEEEETPKDGGGDN